MGRVPVAWAIGPARRGEALTPEASLEILVHWVVSRQR
jgi:hypothetical protein